MKNKKNIENTFKANKTTMLNMKHESQTHNFPDLAAPDFSLLNNEEKLLLLF